MTVEWGNIPLKFLNSTKILYKYTTSEYAKFTVGWVAYDSVISQFINQSFWIEQ